MAALEREMATYSQSLPTLQSNAGKYVLIKNDDIVGVYDTYADALKVGYERFRLEPFLVKQIAPEERVLQFTRELDVACQF